jgi:hypothetical protein
MAVREDIKVLLAREAITLTELAEMLSEKTEKKFTVYGLSRKLLQSTMRYDEVKEIADCLGYEVDFKKKQ